MRPFPLLLLLFPVCTAAAGFPSVRSSAADIRLLAGKLVRIRRMLSPRPAPQALAAAFRGHDTPLRIGGTSCRRQNGMFTGVVAPGVWLVLESPARLVLSDGNYVYTETDSPGGRFCTFTEGALRWQGTFPPGQTIPAAQSLTVGDATVITRSRRTGEYALTLTDKHGYGYRICANGVLSFTKLTSGSLFSRLDWLQGRGAGLLAAAAGDVPGNHVSRILEEYRRTGGDFADLNRLAAFALSFFRQASGLAPVQPDPALSGAAAAHAGYLTANMQSGRRHPPHGEYRDGYGFSGETVADRARLAGYTVPGAVAQLVGFEGNPASCIAAWMTGIHHRRILLDPAVARIGFGSAIFAYSDSSGVGVAVVGLRGTPGTPFPHRWPATLPLWPLWDGREEPRLLDPAQGPYGPPLSLFADRARTTLPGVRLFRFPGETHAVPPRPLPWGVRLVWGKDAAGTPLAAATLPYPAAFALLDSLHPR